MEPISILLGVTGLAFLLGAAKKKSAGAVAPGAELPGGAPTGGIIYDKSKYGIKDDKGGCYVPIIMPNGKLEPFYVAVCPTKNANEIKVVGTGGVLYEVEADEQGNVVVVQTGGGTLPIDQFLGLKIVLVDREMAALNLLTNGRATNNANGPWNGQINTIAQKFQRGFTPTPSFENLRVNTIAFAGTNVLANNELVLSFLKGLDIPSDVDYSVKIPYLGTGLDFLPELKSLWLEANKLGLLIPQYSSVKRGYLYKFLNTPLPNSKPIYYPEQYQTVN